MRALLGLEASRSGASGDASTVLPATELLRCAAAALKLCASLLSAQSSLANGDDDGGGAAGDESRCSDVVLALRLIEHAIAGLRRAEPVPGTNPRQCVAAA